MMVSFLDNGVPLPVQFTANDPGHYPCQISLKSANDIRVYQIECTVSPGGQDTQLEFTTPLHQSVTQEIPVVRKIITYYEELSFSKLEQKNISIS